MAYVHACCPPGKSSWRRQNESYGGSESGFSPLHSGGETLPNPGGLHPLLPCSQSLLGGPSAEAESLRPQHAHNVLSRPAAADSSFTLVLPRALQTAVRLTGLDVVWIYFFFMQFFFPLLLRYVPWNLHEPQRGVFKFDDQLDIE